MKHSKGLSPVFSTLIFFCTYIYAEDPQDLKKSYIEKIISTFEKENETDAAIAILEIIESEQKTKEVYLALAHLLKKKKQYNKALHYLEKALELSDDPEIMLSMVEIYRTEKRHGEIEAVLEKIPSNTKVISLKKRYETAALYNARQQYEEALGLYEDLLKTLPANKTILANYAYTLRSVGRIPEALHYYKKALEIDPENAQVRFAVAIAQLAGGDYHNGFKGYELRRQHLRTTAESIYTQKLLWNGTDSLSGKRILVFAEQGLGDTFQFMRYLYCLKKEGAYVIFSVQKKLIDIVKLCPVIDELIALQDPAPEHDYYIPLMSLPAAFKSSVGTIPLSEIPYIYADETLVTEWKEKLAHDQNFKIGIRFIGSGLYMNIFSGPTSSDRSVPLDLLLETLSSLKGISLYSLQEKSEEKGDGKLITFGEEFDKTNGAFMDTAAVIHNLDLIISIDTSVAHLAGALGAKTFIILPKHADWRWMCFRTDTPWYNTVTLFRQKDNNWSTVLEEIRQQISILISEKNSHRNM